MKTLTARTLRWICELITSVEESCISTFCRCRLSPKSSEDGPLPSVCSVLKCSRSVYYQSSVVTVFRIFFRDFCMKKAKMEELLGATRF